jgi:23S rRNA (guanosine2251-2'-O)-methyltransferase
VSDTSFVPGRRPALEAVRAGRAREILVAPGARRTSGLRDLLRTAREAGVPVSEVPAERLDRASDGAVHQGVVAVVESPNPRGEAELGRAWPEDALVVVLDGVTDPRNVGAVARSAEAAGAAALVVRRRRGSGLEPSAVKASAGALLHLPLVVVPNLRRALERLQSGGFWVVGLDGRAPGDLLTAEPPSGRLALVLGAEGEGLSRLVGEGCDELLSIPVRGRMDSLNVSVAAGIALFGYAVRGRTKQD